MSCDTNHTSPLTIAVLGIRGFPHVQGGVEVHCQHIYPLMTDAHIRVYRRRPYVGRDNPSQWSHVEFVDLPSTRIQGFETAFHTICAVLHAIRHRPQVAHVHNMGPALLALPLRWVGIPVVMTYHSVNYEHAKWGRFAKWLLRQSERLSLRYCDRVIFVNRFRMEQFPEWVRKKSVYIPNGIDAASRTTATDFLERHGVVPGRYVLAVGRLAHEKGFDLLVEAANRLPEVEQLVVAGASDHNTSYEWHLRHLDVGQKVKFVGFADADALRQLYSHARLMVIPSRSEGFPLTLLEAMSYGLPLVASDLPATHLVKLENDDYFAVENVADLCEKIKNKLMKTSSLACYDLSLFDWGKIARKTLDEIVRAARG